MTLPRVLLTGASGFIGTNLVDALEGNAEIVNVDVRAPARPRHRAYWREGDIMDPIGLTDIVRRARPHYLVHLAARTDCDEGTTVEEGYGVNVEGTENVLRAVASSPTLRRVVVTSTQYVSGPDHTPAHDEDFGPHTVYGASKVLTEELTRKAALEVPWTLIRPVNVWGPWHERYRREFWRVAGAGLYVHPAGPPVLRTYGYVGNVVWQIGEILSAPAAVVDGRVLYVGDRPIDVFEWADAFCRALRGRGAPRVPRAVLRVLGWVGDAVTAAGAPFPLTSSRFRNMIQSYAVDIGSTFALLGEPPFSLHDGVSASAAWLGAADARAEPDWPSHLAGMLHLPVPDDAGVRDPLSTRSGS